MLDAALAAAGQVFTPPFRRVLWKTLGLTFALLALVWAAIHKLIVTSAALPYPWGAWAVSILSGAGLFVGLAYLITPVSFLVAGYFFDELALESEQVLAPGEMPGRAPPFGQSLWLSIKFAAVSLAVNLAALMIWLIPGVNAAVFFAANAYLSGRGYFELAASRHLPMNEVHRLRKSNGFRLFGAGLFIAGLLAVPIANLLTPLFATAFMVRIVCRVRQEARRTRAATI
ncbi:MAG: sulfate transporter family protein [Methylocapsa sp.]|nr:sulfate transporter family protein [Methylocapsa sp.]